MWNTAKFKKDSKKGLLYNGKEIKRKVYYNEDEDQNIYQVEKALLDKSEFRNSEGTIALNDVMGISGLFENPKPIGLIKHLVNLVLQNKPNSIVLDFFAGSGTTGHAVLDLNKQDGGNRQFILVTNNEPTDSNPNGIAYDVTSKRLKRVMSGECYDGNTEFKWVKDNKPYGNNLEVTEIAEVSDKEDAEGLTPFDVIDQTLYCQEEFQNPKDKIDWVCKNFSITTKKLGE